MKGALAVLVENWPSTISFTDLELAVGEKFRAEGAPPPVQTKLREAVFRGVFGGLIIPHTQRVTLEKSIPEHPRVTPLTKAQAASGRGISNAYHHPLVPDEIVRMLLQLADGSRNVEALARELTHEVGVKGKEISPAAVRLLLEELRLNAIPLDGN